MNLPPGNGILKRLLVCNAATDVSRLLLAAIYSIWAASKKRATAGRTCFASTLIILWNIAAMCCPTGTLTT
jgi:hypothetical protein